MVFALLLLSVALFLIGIRARALGRPGRAERSLATVLFTDIVGSTERAAAMGDSAWKDLLRQHNRLVRKELRRFGGSEVNTAGDGFLATFDEPARAIVCASSIRDSVKALGLALRCGIHMGEIEWSDGDVGGIAVHIAARVEALADPGEILVSSTVHDSKAGSGFVFEERGFHALKGVPTEWRVYSVAAIPESAPRSLGEPLARRAARHAAFSPLVLSGSAVALLAALFMALPTDDDVAPDAGTIAILPFTASGPDADVWREGMMDLLSINLDGAGNLRAIDTRTVLARWNERVADEKAPDLATALDVAERAGARYALLGTAVALGSDMRLAADVYDVEGGRRLGQSQTAGSSDSLRILVDRLSIETLRMILREGPGDLLPRVNLASVTTSSLPALKAYLRGEGRFRRSDFSGAIRHYEQAVAADSVFALAFYRLGESYGWRESIESESGLEYVQRAAQLADRLPGREAILARASLALLEGTLGGLEPLQRAVERYPDDPEAWYLLGDTYIHLGQQALIDRAEADRALSRAITLDPGFTPAYIHLIEDGFYGADRSRVARLIQRYGRYAAGSREAAEFELASDLVFADSNAQRRAYAALDTLDVVTLEEIADLLQHPRFLEVQERVLRAAASRPEASWETAQVSFFAFFRRGKYQEALRQLEEPTMPAEARGEAAYQLLQGGLSVLPGWLERELIAGTSVDPPTWATFFGGVYAVDRDRWEDHAMARDRFRRRAHDLQAEGDSATARLHEGAAAALEGYALWKRGRTTEARPVLERSREMTVLDLPVNEAIRWWLAEISLETGQDVAAERYFRSFWDSPLAALRLGAIYAGRGEREKARQAYEFFLLAWRDADPEFQPRLEKARQDLALTTRAAPRSGR